MLTNLNFTSTEVMAGLLLLFAVVGIAILYGRYRLGQYAEKDLKALHANDTKAYTISNRSKYPEVDVFRNSGVFFKLGLVIVLGVVVLASNWTQFKEDVVIPEGAMEMEFDIAMEAPPQTSTPPPPPPPPPPVIQEVPDDVVLADDQDVFTDQSADANMSVTNTPVAAVKAAAPPPPPPPPPPPAIVVKEIFKVVEEMPRFPGCETVGTMDEKKACAQEKLLEFIYANIKYPAIARDNNVQGTVVVRFVVTEDGKIEGAEVVRDIGAGCGEEALRVVNLMNTLADRWTPGMQRGRKVPVYFNLPVKFILKVSP
ncbi:MAG: energy transducer TonB [Saprospiraceae bacterium]